MFLTLYVNRLILEEAAHHWLLSSWGIRRYWLLETCIKMFHTFKSISIYYRFISWRNYVTMCIIFTIVVIDHGKIILSFCLSLLQSKSLQIVCLNRGRLAMSWCVDLCHHIKIHSFNFFVSFYLCILKFVHVLKWYYKIYIVI